MSTRSSRLLPRIMLGCCCLLLAAGTTLAEVTVQDPGSFVVDTAGLIDEETKTSIENWLRELEQQTGAQVKLLTVSAMDGEDIFGFSQRHFDLWRLGKAEQDNGALIVLAETTDAGRREAWAKRGTAFFRSKSRRSAKAIDRDAGRAQAKPDGTQPASGGTGAT